MATLGDIVDIHRQFWQPCFGGGGLDDTVAQIERSVDAFENSLTQSKILQS